VPEDWIFVGADLIACPGDPAEITARMAEIASARGDTQPIRTRTSGSTFKNPDSAKAWKLIDQAGCRGLMIGGAKVSEQHCNFLINTGSATADDLENLGEEVRRRVHEQSGVTLEWEVKRIGVSHNGSRGSETPEVARHG
jgi:UDP-N-acetylmuramate dehydrogenase